MSILHPEIVSRRGVVFFRAQDAITTEHQKELARRLGKLSGGPKTSDLHIHPVNNSRENPGIDDHTSMVGSRQIQDYAGIGGALSINADGKRQSSCQEWHSDIQWERVPCDYSVLRMEVIPPTGGGKQYPPLFKAVSRTLGNSMRHYSISYYLIITNL